MAKRSERTFVLLKPETFYNIDVCEAILKRIRKARLRIAKKELILCDKKLVQRHYEEHKGAKHYRNLINKTKGRVVIALEVRGNNAVQVVRSMIGSCMRGERVPGTIRGDFMKPRYPDRKNFIDAADSISSAEREIAIWFPEG